ncbi:MAG TPA: class I SAM-dependent methyltransferase, partial [Acidimicrobiales bacterium]|nr:class I SAM-dependent methyltransferase [Acidimicrobiales bacterium]
AAIYDLVYTAQGKSYQAESLYVAHVVRQRCPEAATLLDVACGTGGHLQWLQQDFAVEGVELSPAMAAVARERLPGVTVHEGDMRSFDLGRRFDAVTCLFSSIGYMVTEGDLHAAVTRMAAHLRPGGVLVVEPWLHPDTWRPGVVHADSAVGDGLAVSRVTRSTREADTTVVELRYSAATPERTWSFVEEHRLALFTAAQYEAAFRAAGLHVEHDPVGPIGRGLFVGVHRRSGG